MTISDLIDYLNQFPADTKVVLSEGDLDAASEREFIALDTLYFND